MDANVNRGIAKTHLLSRMRQTIIAILGVTFGISMFILMIGFMKGTNNFLQDAMLSSTPDIHIYSEIKTNYSSSVTDEYFKNDPNRLVILHNPMPKNVNKNLKNIVGVISNIERNPKVEAVSPVLSAQVFFSYGPAQLNGLIEGVNINEEKSVLNLSKKMTAGRAENLSGMKNGILLGQGIADNLNAHLGDMVTVFFGAKSMMRFRVVGTFQFGLGAIDNTRGIVNITSVQQLLGKNRDYVTDINVKLKDINESKQVAGLFAKKYGYKADDWATANASILATVVARDVMTYVVSIAMLIVAGFGIYNIMNITVTSKLKDIAILKAEGFTGKDIAGIFLSQSAVIGFIGAILGISLGFLFCYIISHVPFPKSDIVTLKYFPVLFEIKYYVFGVVFGVVTTCVASLMPSIKASKSDPVEILRG